ncbi:MAG: T9SS type A sorting domain-containing protein [Ferruginibacter sp.]
MKRVLPFFLFLFFFSGNVKSQYVFLSDQGLYTALRNMFPGCFNASGQMDTTCTAITTITSMQLRGGAPGTLTAIRNLQGLRYFDALKYLDCAANSLEDVSGLPPGLETLICSGQRRTDIFNYYALTGLGPLPEGLRYLDCSNNGLFSLNFLPSSLRTLNCSIQRSHYSWGGDVPSLTSIGAFPESLEYFNGSGTGISVLPSLPSTLKYLNVEGNKWSITSPFGTVFSSTGVTTLPALPASLDYLNVRLNGLSQIPALPQNLRFLACDRNDSLRCLPVLPASLSGNSAYVFPLGSTNVYTAQTLINCLPNIVPGMRQDVTRPVCTQANNTNGCTVIIISELNVTPANLVIQTVTGQPSASSQFTTTGITLSPSSGSITITPSANLEVSLNNTTFSSVPISLSYTNGTINGVNVYVRIAASAAVGTFSGNVTFSGGNAPTVVRTVNASVLPATPGIINVTPASLAIQTTTGNASISGRFTLTGSSFWPLSGPITITPSANLEVSLNNSNFSSSPIVKNYNNGALSTSFVYVRIAATAPVGSFNGTVTFSGGNAPTVTRTVNASVVPAVTPGVINVTPASLNLQTTTGLASVSGRYTLTGNTLFPLSGPITITPSANLQVSLNNTTFSSTPIVKNYNNGALSTTFVYVRIAATAPLGNFNGTVTFSGGNAPVVVRAVNASVQSVVSPGILNVTPSSLLLQTSTGVPSVTGRFTLTGNTLFPTNGPVTITPSANLEVSLNNTTFSTAPIVKNYSNGNLSATFVYVRISAAAPIGNFVGTVTFSGGNAPTVVRNVNSTVTMRGAFVSRPETQLPEQISISEKELKKANSSAIVSLYPNPAADFVNLVLPDFKQGTMVDLYTIQGKQLLRLSVTGTTTRIDVSSFAKGMYILKVHSPEFICVKQLVIN